MTNEKNLNYVSQPPKTYEQFVLEEKQLTPRQQQDLYPEFGYEDINEQKSYGPTDKTDKKKITALSYYSDAEASANKSEANIRNLGLDSSILHIVSPRSFFKRRCAALGCSYSLLGESLPEGEHYCSIHKLMMGKEIAELAKSFNETASKEGGMVIVSQENSNGKSEATVKYHSNKKN